MRQQIQQSFLVEIPREKRNTFRDIPHFSFFLSSTPQISMVYRLMKPREMLEENERIRKSVACGSWFMNFPIAFI